jgi:glutamyl-tRNA reductase
MSEMVEREWNEKRREPKNLLMLGVCLENVVGPGQGPDLAYTTPETLTAVKLSHPEVIKRLKDIAESGIAEECFCLNTCNRFEVYLKAQGDAEYVRQRLVELFFASLPEGQPELNTLKGADVVHHLMRTAVGLNSGLPGETDVEGQLSSALVLATKIQVLSEEAAAWFAGLMKTASDCREETGWRTFKPNYCEAALEGALARADKVDLESGNIVIVGSSNTSRTCVEVLENRFEFDHNKITVYHRCHRADGQMKSIRRTTNGCKRKRVEDYSSPIVGQAIADSALTIFGIDRDRPVLGKDALKAYRNGHGKRAMVVDFNTFGSTDRVDAVEGIQLVPAQELEREVREYAKRMTDNPDFCKAVMEIEEALAERIESFMAPLARG